MNKRDMLRKVGFGMAMVLLLVFAVIMMSACSGDSMERMNANDAAMQEQKAAEQFAFIEVGRTKREVENVVGPPVGMPPSVVEMDLPEDYGGYTKLEFADYKLADGSVAIVGYENDIVLAGKTRIKS